MQIITELLARYKNIRPPDAAIKNTVLAVVQNTVGVKLHRSDVSVAHSVVYIQSDPTTKSTLFVHKNEILRKIKESVGETAVKDIR